MVMVTKLETIGEVTKTVNQSMARELRSCSVREVFCQDYYFAEYYFISQRRWLCQKPTSPQLDRRFKETTNPISKGLPNLSHVVSLTFPMRKNHDIVKNGAAAVTLDFTDPRKQLRTVALAPLPRSRHHTPTVLRFSLIRGLARFICTDPKDFGADTWLLGLGFAEGGPPTVFYIRV